MKKITSYLLALFVFASITFLTTSCGEDAEDPATPLPAADGTIIIDFTNFPNTGTPSVSAATGDVITVSVRMQKSPSGTRPQKLRVWEATAPNTRGTQVGSTIDLRNVDDQTKTVDYTVSATSGTIYLYFEVDESASKFSRKTLTVNVSGSGSVASFSGIVLGAQNNVAGSRLSSSTGDIYKVCDVPENINYIDITYAALGSPIASPTLLSNPQRATEGLSTSTTNSPCQDPTGGTSNVNVNTGGGRETYFATSTVDFAAADDAALSAIAVTTSAPKKIVVANGGTYAFLNSDGKKGLIKVTSLTSGVSGSITFDIKVQR